ncbi:MAG TPA: XkdX family protein [Tissierellia bacterium]|nr:XkdX family protein [Tissierellia bacterium]
MTDAMKRLYKFLVKINRITKEQYEQIVGEPYAE